MRITDTSDLWWKHAVVYCLDVETFLDANGDGCGDLPGLAQSIDYLADLGVTCLWLMPFSPSPDRDDGYDITDFYGVDPRLGNHGDLVEVLRTAKDRGMRVIVDLVVNHTSDKHPWFVSAKRSVTSPYRDWYVWTDDPPSKAPNTVFPGEEASVWELEPKSGQYYLHSFYRHQPDLNIANPEVRDEIAKIVGFWLALGISGFRIDAVPFLIEPPAGAEIADPHEFLRDLKRFLRRRAGDAMLLGEVNLPHAGQLDFFGDDGAELDLQFDFASMQALFLSLARHDPAPLAVSLAGRPPIAIEAAWANFVRNHDELTLDQLSATEREGVEDLLTLDQLSATEREEVFDALAPDDDQRVYGRGIVRRIPPMLGGDPRRVRMVYSLLFSLPGTPVLFYGEEIGMGENPDLGGRSAVRSPMQWRDAANGGFSTAPKRSLVAVPPAGGYAPEHVNVERQQQDSGSLLHFIRTLTSRYRTAPELGWGELAVIDHDTPSVLAHTVSAETGRILALHNFADEPVSVRFRLPGADQGATLIDLLGANTCDVGAGEEASFELDPYAYRWFRVRASGTASA